MWFFENRLVFKPVTAASSWEDKPDAAIEDVPFASSDGTPLFGWFLPHPTARTALLLCRQRRQRLAPRQHAPPHPRRAGNVGLRVRLSGLRSERRQADRGRLLRRRGRGVGVARRPRVAAEIVVCGESLGGGVAAELATRREFRAVLLVKAFASVPAVAKSRFPWFPAESLLHVRFDNLARMPAIRSPVHVAGATRDSVVPFAHSERLFAAANGPKRFFRLEGQDHGDRLPDDYWADAKAFAARPGGRPT